MAEDRRRGREDFFNSSQLSPTSPGSHNNTAISSPASPGRAQGAQDAAYNRLTSTVSPDVSSPPTISAIHEAEQDLGTLRGDSSAGGLGLSDPMVLSPVNFNGLDKTSTPRGVGAYKDNSTTAIDPFASRASQSTFYDTTVADGESITNRNASERRSSAYRPGYDRSQTSTERLLKTTATPSIRSTRTKASKFEREFHPANCPSKRNFWNGSSHWFAIAIYILLIFSTVFSGIFLVIALKAPRYGRKIHTNGSLTVQTSAVLTQLFAKLTELSFAAVFVAFLGQVLSRRAFSLHSRGVSLAELTMRNWIMQPGTLFTHWESVRYAALTFLGATSLTVAILAMLYTTAVSALVAPVLKFGAWEETMLHGVVKASFANPNYVASQCTTPVKANAWDPEFDASKVGQVCLTIEHAAQGFNNYQKYLWAWNDYVAEGNGSEIQAYRPPGLGLFQYNTSVNASWIHNIDVKEVSKAKNRIINNVTLAYPHVGVFAAARTPKSDIMQPEELDGQGAYNIQAQVASPYINVICAHVKKSEIKDLIYETSGSNITLNATTDLPLGFTYKYDWSKFNNISTPVDDIFGWDSKKNPPPIFYKWPKELNTITNNTAPWGRTQIYTLGKGGTNNNSTLNGEYMLCAAKAGMTTNCSTHYNAIGSGGSLSAHCDDPDDKFAYIKGNSSRVETVSEDFFNVATTMFNALSLNAGVTNGDAANARLLMQLMLEKGELNPALPSPAEALAVMTGCSLLMAAQDSPFVEFWNYTKTEISGAMQQFPAKVRAQQYASGGAAAYQRGFMIVLIAVFLTNVLVLIYFAVNRGLVTDFSEPPNLFAITINSPPTNLMSGSCGGGPEQQQFAIKWGIHQEDDHLYMSDRREEAPFGHPSASGSVWSEARMSFRDLGALLSGKKFSHQPVPNPQNDTLVTGPVEYGRGASHDATRDMELGASTTYQSQGVVDLDEERDEPGPLKSAATTSTEDSRMRRMYSKVSKRRSLL